MKPLLSFLTPRAAPAGCALLAIAIGLGARGALSGVPANMFGTAVWTVLVACIVVCVSPRLSGLQVALISGAIGLGAELFQLTGVPLALYRMHSAAALVFGTTFQWSDLPAYVIGALMGGALQHGRLSLAPPDPKGAP